MSFESVMPSIAGQLVGQEQAPATTGPARGPRPASSTPINALQLSLYLRSSKAKVKPTRSDVDDWTEQSGLAGSAVFVVSLLLLFTADVDTEMSAFDLTTAVAIVFLRGCEKSSWLLVVALEMRLPF
jgi:hypothetical protein